MRFPNGYGGIIKLSGKRRKPYAVRVTTGVKEVDGRFVQQYKYIGYFAKRPDAMKFLADYNHGVILSDTPQKLTDMPTFAEVYSRWWEEREKLRPVSASAVNNYTMAYKHMAALHPRRFSSIRAGDLQELILQYSDRSKSTINFLLVVLHGMYKYALRWDLVDKDYSQGLEAVYSREKTFEHKPFTDEEIAALWAHKDTPDAFMALILIYTGMRCSELLNLRNENIHLEERYMVAGMKTEAGRDRVIPIAEKIAPLIAEHMSTLSEYFYPSARGKAYDFSRFNTHRWKALMAELGMSHLTHDCRHTFATLAARAGISDFHRKLIMGHAVKDLTNGVYTHVAPEELIRDVDRL